MADDRTPPPSSSNLLAFQYSSAPEQTPCVLKEDGQLDAQFVAHRIVFQSSLNVLLLFGQNNEIRIVDTNAGNVLQTVRLPGEFVAPGGGGGSDSECMELASDSDPIRFGERFGFLRTSHTTYYSRTCKKSIV